MPPLMERSIPENPVKSIVKGLLRPSYRRARKFVFERLPVLYRDGSRYDHIAAEIRRLRPGKIVEIGTCKGDNAERMLRLALWYRQADYYGFDLFEEMGPEKFAQETAIWPAPMELVESRLKGIKFRGRTPGVRLFKGDTTRTLRDAAPEIGRADLIYIDGGHSYETVRSDWENSAALCGPGTVVLIDDYPNWGVGPLVDGIDRSRWKVEIIEPGDFFHHSDPPLNCKLARVTMAK